MRRLWPVALAAVMAGHAIWTGNATGFVITLWLGVVYVAALGLANPKRHVDRVDLGHLNDLELRRTRARHDHQEPVR